MRACSICGGPLKSTGGICEKCTGALDGDDSLHWPKPKSSNGFKTFIKIAALVIVAILVFLFVVGMVVGHDIDVADDKVPDTVNELE